MFPWRRDKAARAEAEAEAMRAEELRRQWPYKTPGYMTNPWGS